MDDLNPAPAPAEVQSPAPPPHDLTAFVGQLVTDAVNAAVANLTRPSDIAPAVLAAAEADIKPFWQSKTLTALAAQGLVLGGTAIGLHLDPDGSLVIAGAGVIAALALTGLTAVFHSVSTKRPV